MGTESILERGKDMREGHRTGEDVCVCSCRGTERLPVKWGVGMGIRGWVEASEVGTAGIGKGTLTGSQ